MTVVWLMTRTVIISSPPYQLAVWPSNLLSSGHWKHFPESKVAVLLSWPHTSTQFWGYKHINFFTHSPMYLVQ